MDLNTVRVEDDRFPLGTRHVWRGRRGHVEFIRLREDVVLVVLSGHLDGEAAAYLVANLPMLMDRPGLRVFWDGGELASQGARVPAQVVPALARLCRNVDEFHMLVHSPLLNVTAAAASLALGAELTVYRDRESFDEAVIREAIQPSWSRFQLGRQGFGGTMAMA
jgi:hypothetical protein